MSTVQIFKGCTIAEVPVFYAPLFLFPPLFNFMGSVLDLLEVLHLGIQSLNGVRADNISWRTHSNMICFKISHFLVSQFLKLYFFVLCSIIVYEL